jgi:hypothetical protein
MFGKVAAFEFRYQVRQPVLYVTIIVFFLLSFGLIASENISIGAGGNVHKNAPMRSPRPPRCGRCSSCS